MILESIAYVCGFGFQMAGSFILIRNFGKACKNKNIITQTYKKDGIADYGDEDYGGEVETEETAGTTEAAKMEKSVRTFELDKDSLVSEAIDNYRNTLAFAYIFLGYIMSMFGNIDENCRCCACLAAIFIAFVLFEFGRVGTYGFAKRNFEENVFVNVDENDNITEVKKGKQ